MTICKVRVVRAKKKKKGAYCFHKLARRVARYLTMGLLWECNKANTGASTLVGKTRQHHGSRLGKHSVSNIYKYKMSGTYHNWNLELCSMNIGLILNFPLHCRYDLLLSVVSLEQEVQFPQQDTDWKKIKTLSISKQKTHKTFVQYMLKIICHRSNLIIYREYQPSPMWISQMLPMW